MAYRMLMVTDSYPPLIGGATRDTQVLCRELVKRDYRITVATAWNPGMLEHERDDDAGVDVYRIKGLASRVPWFSTDPRRRHHPPWPDPAAVLQFRKLVRMVRPELVHTYGWISYSCLAALVRSNIPTVLSVRDYSSICALRTLLRHTDQGTEICDGPSLRTCMRCAPRYYHGYLKGAVAVTGVRAGTFLLRRKLRGLHCCSTYAEEVVADTLLGREAGTPGGGRQITVRAIQSFRDDSGDEAADQELLSRLPSEPYILFVGALRLVKGIVPLIQAYRLLEAPPPLVFLGTPQSDTPRDFPPGAVVFHNVPHGTVMAAWDRALFGVAPSILPEPLGNVVHEAMSKGKAVIGTTPGGMRDMIVDGETGLLVPAGDVGALTQAMQRLIADAPLRERMGQAALQRAPMFAAETLIPRFEALYDEVMQRRTL